MIDGIYLVSCNTKYFVTDEKYFWLSPHCYEALACTMDIDFFVIFDIDLNEFLIQYNMDMWMITINKKYQS